MVPTRDQRRNRNRRHVPAQRSPARGLQRRCLRRRGRLPAAPAPGVHPPQRDVERRSARGRVSEPRDRRAGHRIPGRDRAALGLHQPFLGDRDRRHRFQRCARLRDPGPRSGRGRDRACAERRRRDPYRARRRRRFRIAAVGSDRPSGRRPSTGCASAACCRRSRSGSARCPQDYASRIVNYVDTAEDLYTLPRRTAQVGKVVDVQTSSLSFFGQLQAALGTDSLGGNVLESVYDWLATADEDRQRAQRLLMALEHEFGGVELVDGAGQAIAAGSAADTAQTEALLAELNTLMQTDRADLIQSRAFDRMLVDGSGFGRAAGCERVRRVGRSAGRRDRCRYAGRRRRRRRAVRRER